MPDKNPVDEVLRQRKTAAVVRQERELGHWQTWKQNGYQPEHLEPLLDAYQPLIKRKAIEWGPQMIPKPALEAELTKHVIGAFKTYNPDRGASLNTHVQHRIKKALRFVVKHQNIAYIPETRAYKIGDLQRAVNNLTDDLGRPPTPQELADHSGMTMKTVKQLQKEMIRDVPSSSLESDPFPRMGSREREVLALLPSVLTPQEKQVFDLVYHPNSSMRVTSTTQLAQKLNLNPSQVSRLKTGIINKVKGYL